MFYEIPNSVRIKDLVPGETYQLKDGTLVDQEVWGDLTLTRPDGSQIDVYIDGTIILQGPHDSVSRRNLNRMSKLRREGLDLALKSSELASLSLNVMYFTGGVLTVGAVIGLALLFSRDGGDAPKQPRQSDRVLDKMIRGSIHNYNGLQREAKLGLTESLPQLRADIRSAWRRQIDIFRWLKQYDRLPLDQRLKTMVREPHLHQLYKKELPLYMGLGPDLSVADSIPRKFVNGYMYDYYKDRLPNTSMTAPRTRVYIWRSRK